MGRFIDLTGQTFNRLTVIKLSHKAKPGKYFWLCHCKCGRECVVAGMHLRSGNTKSCGCRKEETRLECVEKGTIDRRTRRKAYVSYRAMLTRCLNLNSTDYQLYGGRGIKIAQRWLAPDGFANFFADMGECPPGMTIDRINPDGNYEPGNCRWATHTDQARNKRNNRQITWRGQTRSLAEWAELVGKPASWLHKRLCPFGRIASAQVLPGPTPFCRRDTDSQCVRRRVAGASRL
jgi:hypothetical protein